MFRGSGDECALLLEQADVIIQLCAVFKTSGTADKHYLYLLQEDPQTLASVQSLHGEKGCNSTCSDSTVYSLWY